MDSSTYRHLLGQIKNSCPIPHYNFPSHNLLSIETLLEVSKYARGDEPNCYTEFLASFPCYHPFPYAVQQSHVLFCGSGVTDEANNLVKRKLGWEKELKNLSLSNIDAAVKSIKRMKENKIVALSNNLKNYIEHFHYDPEPMFSGNYNWLYTGGSLCHDEKSDGVILLSGNFFTRKSGFSLLQLNDTQDKIVRKSFRELKASSPVLQITCKPQKENLIICVRQKNYLSLFNMNRMNSLCKPVKIWKKKVLGSKLLTGADVETNCEEVIVTDSNHDINIFHIENKNKISSYSGRKIASNFTGDAWSQVEFGDLGVYWALRNCFTIFDPRDFSSGAKLKYEPSSATNLCEKISSFVKSSINSNFLYLSTTHNLLQMDLRNGKTVQRWTHLMKNPPQFMGIIKDKEENEVLFLQSPSVDEIVGITNKCEKYGENVNFVSRSLPCLLDSVKESLNLARVRGKCLSPSVVKRLNFSVTGMKCLKNSENDMIVLTSNSGGDIFINKIKKKTSMSVLAAENEDQVIKAMETFESNLEKFPLKKSIGSHLELIDMSRILDDVRHPKKRSRKYRKPSIDWKLHEYSAENMEFFRDVLAQKILKVWRPSGPEIEGSNLDNAVMSVDAKVKEWMNKC